MLGVCEAPGCSPNQVLGERLGHERVLVADWLPRTLPPTRLSEERKVSRYRQPWLSLPYGFA
jgi:hypothetical protein